MSATQIKDGFAGGSDNQLKVNSDGSINVNTSGGGVASNVTITQGGNDATVTAGGALTVTGTVGGSVVPAGLFTAGRVTTMQVSTTAVALPVAPLSGRNAMSLVNLSAQTLYIGFDASITADSVVGTTSGWEIGPNEGFNIDVAGSIPIYGIVASGTILVKIMELS